MTINKEEISNKKITKICIIFVIILFSLYILFQLFGGLYIGGLFNLPMSEENMIELFDKDKEILIESACDLSEKDDIYLCLDDMFKEEVTGTGINKKLYDKGYEIISKNDNFVSYQKWSNLDAGKGFVYSYNEEKPLQQFTTKLIPLNEIGWYYYEEDFNKWKKGQK